MQQGRNEPVRDSISKPILLGLITSLTIGVVAPLVIPHATHPSMIFHITLHIASLTIAVFLSIIAFLAYVRSPCSRLLLMAFGFATLVAIEFLYLLDATGTLFMLDTLQINELSHVILFVMLTLFGLGVLKVNK